MAAGFDEEKKEKRRASVLSSFEFELILSSVLYCLKSSVHAQSTLANLQSSNSEVKLPMMRKRDRGRLIN